MLITCWSSKGGVGTTVVATALALTLARAEGSALLVDLGGDVPAVLGLADPPEGSGIAALAAGGAPGPEVLARHERPAGAGLSLLGRGAGPVDPGAVDGIVGLLGADPRPVVVDAGVLGPAGAPADGWAELALGLAAGAARSLLVVRPCFLALRRAIGAPVRPSAVVVVSEEGRALGPSDIEQAVGAPVLAEVRVSAQVARAVDAGILGARLPRTLERELRRAA